MVRISDFDGLTVYLEKAGTDVFEAIEESMQEVNEQGLTPTEYDATIRPFPDEIVAWNPVIDPRLKPWGSA